MVEPSPDAAPMEAAAIRALSEAEALLLQRVGRLVIDGSGTYRLLGSVPEDIAADREDFDTSRFIDESEAIALQALTDSEIRDLWCAGRLVRDCTGFRLIDPPKQKLKLWERVAWFASLSGAAAFLIGLGGVAVVGFGETAMEAIAKLAHVRLGDIAEFISICVAFVVLSAGFWWLTEGRRR